MTGRIFRRHVVSSAALCFYFLWWTLPLYLWFRPVAGDGRNTCDFSPMVYIFITVVIAGVLSLAFLIRALLARGPYNDDYWWFIAMVSFPLATGFFCL